jgi:phosphoglucosamine mutase
MSKRAYFGTDGIRGEANTHPMTAEVALRIGLAAGKLFRSRDEGRHMVVIGKDTRLSGYMVEPALVAGFTSAGMDVRLLGPMPTPGVAMMTRSLRADLGVMISASHNPWTDNGIKLFGPDGYKTWPPPRPWAAPPGWTTARPAMSRSPRPPSPAG